MKREKLTVQKRTVLGKNVKKLRREGILPGNVYGKDVKSTAVQLPTKTFMTLYKEVGETGLIDLELDGQLRPVLIHNVHIDHVANQPLHADFFQVNLKEKITTNVPIVLIGEPKAVTDKIGMLMQTLNEVEVEALPEALPENIEVNVEPLTAVDEQITVADLKKPAGVEILSDPAQVVVKIADLVSEETKELAAEMAAEAEAATEEAPAEGEEKEKTEGEETNEEEAAAKDEANKASEEKPKEEKKE